MTQLVTLDSRTHRDLRVVPRPGRESLQINAVSVIPREFPRLLAHYPIFFTRSAETGRFEPAALLGFERQENLFYLNDRWDVAYMPLQFQRLPFSLLPRRADPGRGSQDSLDVAIDLDSSQIQAQEGERLFTEEGGPSNYLQNISSILSALVSGSTEAYAFTARLAELNLIESVQIEIEFVDRSQSKLQGLYWIDAKVLKALPAAQLAELRDRGFLEWLYFQMASVAHVSSLVARKNQLLSGMTPTRPA